MFSVEDRGWSANPADVTAHRVVLWMHNRQQADSGGIPTSGHAADDLGVPSREVVGVIERLHERGLAMAPASYSFDGANASLTDEGLSLASAWHIARDNPRARRVACRDAVLDWMDEQDESLPDALSIARDPRSFFFGRQFTENEINAAVDHLAALGLVRGSQTSSPVLVRPTVTPEGRTCVERYGSSVAAWEGRSASASTSYTFTGNQGLNFAANSPGAVQTVTMNTDNREQVLHVADALEQMTPALGLSDADTEAVRLVTEDLRDAAHGEADTGRLGRAFEKAKALAMKGSGQAAGAALVLLVNEAGAALGLG
jgi:hypothetical protein